MKDLTRTHGTAPATVADYVAASISANTQRAYSGTLRAYDDFTKARAIDPLDAGTVAAFLAWRGTDKAPSSVARDLAAIKWARRIKGQPIPSSEAERLEMVLQGIQRAGADRPKTKKRAAVADTVKLMVSRLDGTLQDKRDRALILCGFALMARRSELAALQLDDLEETEGGLYITIRKSKTDQTGQGFRKFLPATGTPFDPVAALRAWIDAAGITSGAIFRGLRKGGRIRPEAMTGQGIADAIKRAAENAGLDPEQFAGHSLRRGGITEAAERGASTYAIMAQSGHKSPAMIAEYVEARDKRANYPLKGSL